MDLNGKFARYASKMRNSPKFKGHKEKKKKMINTDGNLDALERHLAEREEDDARIDMEQIIEDYKADLEMAQDLLMSAVWLLQDAMIQLEDGKIKTRRNRAAMIRAFLTKITSEGNK